MQNILKVLAVIIFVRGLRWSHNEMKGFSGNLYMIVGSLELRNGHYEEMCVYLGTEAVQFSSTRWVSVSRQEPINLFSKWALGALKPASYFPGKYRITHW